MVPSKSVKKIYFGLVFRYGNSSAAPIVKQIAKNYYKRISVQENTKEDLIEEVESLKER